MNGRALALSISLALVACGGARAAEPAPVSATPEPEVVSDTTSPVDETPSESSSDALARYGHDMMAAVSRYWTIPATLASADSAALEARIEITFDERQIPTGYRIMEGSGNTTFDASVDRALAQLVTEAQPLPSQPPGLDDHGFVRLRLHGRRAH